MSGTEGLQVLSLENGKYELRFDERSGALCAYRYGEPWRDFSGDKLVYLMMQAALAALSSPTPEQEAQSRPPAASTAVSPGTGTASTSTPASATLPSSCTTPIGIAAHLDAFVPRWPLVSGDDVCGDFERAGPRRSAGAVLSTAVPVPQPTYQQRVQAWVVACIGPQAAVNRDQRTHRFVEEALELAQAAGCSAEDAHELVDYVFGRPVGEVAQEVGGVSGTLASLCAVLGIDQVAAAEAELARCWKNIEKIRAKHAGQPARGPLPGVAP